MNKDQILKIIKKQQELYDDLRACPALENVNEICLSGIGGSFFSFIENYQDLLSSYTSEQLAIIVNISGCLWLLNFASSLVFIVLGDELIKYLRLESRYPWLASYIQYKKNLYKTYLKIYIFSIYCIILILLSVNIFMFTYDLI
jgi:hypothetical protein